jgi:malate dehydrogenase (oxaloacetate-decarboxylating)
MDVYEESLELHKKLKGKLKVTSKKPIKTKEDLSLLYTPGVAQPSREIAKAKEKVFEYTGKGNSVAVISDGSAVLGLGNIGGLASLPVMEGKCAIMAEFADLDATPIILNTQEPDEVINVVKAISPSFGAINLEDFAAPNCFYIEENLQDLGIPVFHDDQHGTAIVITAGLINSLKVVGKENKPLKVVISGAGSAGQATARLLLDFQELKIDDIILLDSKGAIYEGRENLDPYKKRISKITNKEKQSGLLKDVIKNADVFIGVSQPDILKPENVKKMAEKPIIFAMANPVPEILPDLAKKAGATVVATGRSDFPNQVNNALIFPGIFRGALDVKAKTITKEMKVAAALSIALLVKEPKPEFIIPSIFDPNLVPTVAKAVSESYRG